MKVLLVGGGGREHAIAWKLSKSKLCKHLYIAPGNPGTGEYGTNVDISDTDLDGILKYCQNKRIDFVVVGPEDPLAMGLVDKLEDAGIKAFGPSEAAAQLEGDKVFAKEVMRANNIPTAETKAFTDYEEAKMYIASRDTGVVVKAAGLAKGKGVFVCDEPSDAILAAEKIMVNRIFGDAGDRVVVEEKLTGQEASILAFVDGRTIAVMETSQDHKPIGDGDTGPNTGGMGAYSPAPVVTQRLMDQIVRDILLPVVDGMNRNETPYKGVLYAGLMLTAGGPKVLEFNCRFGDPETQPVLMRLQSDLLEIMLAVRDGRLNEMDLKWDSRPTVCVVMASGGYPGDYEKGKVIKGISEAEELEGVKVFHAGTTHKDGKVVTNGGRVLGVTAIGGSLAESQALAYEAVERISFEGAYWRTDIAAKALAKKVK
ncbi:MAG: phosphoribosylamine--glycine ligase [Sedimentisphaerales bacterium]|nr:phosphoribosylamine--glycine ligase [Sedimentisphaerales bacterium]